MATKKETAIVYGGYIRVLCGIILGTLGSEFWLGRVCARCLDIPKALELQVAIIGV